MRFCGTIWWRKPLKWLMKAVFLIYRQQDSKGRYAGVSGLSLNVKLWKVLCLLKQWCSPHLVMTLYRSNHKSGHISLLLNEWFASGTSLQIDHHCISLWVPDMQQAAEATDAGGSGVPQNTLHLSQKTGTHNKYNLIGFLFLIQKLRL